VHELCRRLKNLGAEVDVLAPHAPGAALCEVMDGITVYRYRYFFTRLQTLAYAGGLLANLRSNPLNCLILPCLLIGLALALYRRIRVGNYQLVHAHWILPQGFVCALLSTLLGNRRVPPFICTSHGGDLYALDGYWFRRLKAWCLCRARHVTVVSTAMRERCIAMGLPAKKISVLPMGVDLQRLFQPAPGVQRRAHRIIYVGRLVKKKGVDHLLQAVAKLSTRISDIELWIIGDGPLRSALENQAREQRLDASVQFAGAVENLELPALYSAARIAVMPSVVDDLGDQEGLGLVSIEAMGCGCVVVASALPAIRDVIRDGDNGVLARPGDPDDLAARIETLLSDQRLCDRLARNGRASVLEQYDWTVAARKYFELLQSVAAGQQTA
jgi:glycosyltransferase involved in cell wall biosynthesis